MPLLLIRGGALLHFGVVDDVAAVNEAIDISAVPVLEPDDFTRVDPAYVKMLVGPQRVLQIVSSAAVFVAASTLSWWCLVALPVALGLFELILWLRKKAYPALGYQARTLDFSIRSGWIARSVTTLPYRRVQTSLVNQGPWQRRFGLATLVLTSANGAISLPGLKHETAQRLRTFVADQAALADDPREVEDPREADGIVEADRVVEADRAVEADRVVEETEHGD